MWNRLNNSRGNAIIVVVLTAGIALASLGMLLSKVGQYSTEMGKASAQDSATNQDLAALNFLQRKFTFGKSVNTDGSIAYIPPDWYPNPYPVGSELIGKPHVKVISPADANALPEVAIHLIRGNKNDGCKPISPFQPSKEKETNSSLNCGILDYALDASRLGSILKPKLSDDGGSFGTADLIPDAFISIPDLGLMTATEKEELFTSGIHYPTSTAMRSIPVFFKEYVIDESNPENFNKILVQVADTLAILPIDPPPTPSACTLNLISPTSAVDLTLGDKTLKFSISADSIVTSAKLELSNGDYSAFSLSDFDPQRIENIGTLTSLKTTGFDIIFKAADLHTMPSTASLKDDEILWKVSATLTGASGDSISCSHKVNIVKTLPPNCNLTVADPKVLPGVATAITLNCETIGGGPVTKIDIDVGGVDVALSKITGTALNGTKAVLSKTVSQKVVNILKDGNGVVITLGSCSKTIPPYPDLCTNDIPAKGACSPSNLLKGYKNYTCQKYVIKTIQVKVDSDLSGFKKIYTTKFTRLNNTNKEAIVATVTGPGGTTTATAYLGAVCPYNSTNYSKMEFDEGILFTDAGVETWDTLEKTTNPLTFTMGEMTYNGGQDFWRSTAANQSQMPNILIDANGSWNPNNRGGTTKGGNWDTAGICRKNNFCMAVVESVTKANGRTSWEGGGRVYWLEVGPKDSETCGVIATKMRHGGCFAGNTKLRMSDGSERKVSEIGENDLVLNPFYQSPVRVKNVVKGPEKKALYEVSLGVEKIEVTEDHPFLTSRGWVQTTMLRAGDLLVGGTKNRRVASVRKLNYNGPTDVWNFELDTDDSYGHMVLANGIPTGDLTTQILLKKEPSKLP